MKNSVKRAVFVLILLGIAFWFISSKVNEHKLKSKKATLAKNERIETTNIVSAMVTKYNAISDWRKSFKGRLSLYDSTYTIEVQDALVKTDGRPILFFSNLNDIVRKEDEYVLYFGDWFEDLLELDIHFILECTPEQVNKIVPHPTAFENYAVIAQITDVEKVRFQLTAESLGYEQVDVDLMPSNVFIATGHCLDLVFVGNYLLKDFLENKNK